VSSARMQALHTVIRALSYLECCVANSNALRLYDINVVSEHFFERFLSVAYCLQLVSLNSGGQQQPAIDLGDLSLGVCFQVTSDGSKAKVKETIRLYETYNLSAKYPRLRVLIIGPRRGEYANVTVQPGVIFDANDDIVGRKELARHIGTLGTAELQQLESIVQQEMPVFGVTNNVQSQSDVDAIKEYRDYFDRPALRDPWRAEGDYGAFGKALTELVELLNTGWVNGIPIAKRRTRIANVAWKDDLANIYGQLTALRVLFMTHVRSGEIDLSRNVCNFKDPHVGRLIDHYKDSIIHQMNRLLTNARIAPIP
jgi:hypothetical protein